jgi:LAO/AO transport system kinase
VRAGWRPAGAARAAGALDTIERALHGDRRALARVLSVLEGGGAPAAEALRAIYPHAGRAQVVGLTGPAGSGKSTLAAALARYYRGRGERVAVVAVDPTSPYSGGALLGDRVRMPDLAADDGVFIRSMASRGGSGGLALAANAVVAALDAAGYQRVLIETVGAGQAEIAVAKMAHTTVVVTVPGLGDEVQALKAGLFEVGDVLVVNKADRPEADRAQAELAMLQSLAPAAAWQPPVVPTVALTGDGVADLAGAIARHAAYLEATGEGRRRVRERAEAAVLGAAQAEIGKRLTRALGGGRMPALVSGVAEHELSPYDAASDLLAAVGLGTES